MELLVKHFDINTVFLTFAGYRMSYLEFTGTALNLLSVWLVTRNNIWTWPVGNVAVILFGILFYQLRLYSDLVEQAYFLVTGFYGWWVWLYYRRSDPGRGRAEMPVTRGSGKSDIVYLIVIAVGTMFMGYFMKHVHEYYPAVFPAPASFPYLDAFTTVMSFAANILMAHKKVECWYLWILVDIIGIGLYFTKGVVFVSGLYCVFLILAVKGLINWKRAMSVKG